MTLTLVAIALQQGPAELRAQTNDDVTRAKLGIGEEAEQHEHIVDVGRDENDDSE